MAAPASKLLNNNNNNNNHHTMQVTTQDSNLNAVELAEKVKENLTRTKGDQVLKQSGIVKQNQRLRRTFGLCNSDLDGAEVAKRIERKLASMQARVKVGEGGEELRQRVNLVRSKLQRYYFLAQLLPLSKSPSEFAAFMETFKEQKLNENDCQNVGQRVGDMENMGNKRQCGENQTREGGSQLSVVTTTNQGYVVQHAQKNNRGGWDIGETGVKVVEEVYKKWGHGRDQYQTVLQLSDQCWRQFCRWRRRNLDLVEKETGARVDSTRNSSQTIYISGYEEAVKKMVMVLQTLPGGGREQKRLLA